MTAPCLRDGDVLAALTSGRTLDAELREHLAGCAACAEVAEIAALIADDHRAGIREAHPPAAGTVWWRATIRARAEAARTVSQPITLAQGIAAACAIGLACGLVGIAWRWMPFNGFSDLIVGLDARRDELATASALLLQHALPLALALAACLVIAPLALYFALGDD